MLINLKDKRSIDIVAKLVYTFMKYKGEKIDDEKDIYNGVSANYCGLVVSAGRYCIPNLPENKKDENYQLIIDALAAIAGNDLFIDKENLLNQEEHHDMDSAALLLSELFLFADEIDVVPFSELRPYISAKVTAEDIVFVENLIKLSAQRNVDCAISYCAWLLKQGKNEEAIGLFKKIADGILCNKDKNFDDEGVWKLVKNYLCALNDVECLDLMEKAEKN